MVGGFAYTFVGNEHVEKWRAIQEGYCSLYLHVPRETKAQGTCLRCFDTRSAPNRSLYMEGHEAFINGLVNWETGVA